MEKDTSMIKVRHIIIMVLFMIAFMLITDEYMHYSEMWRIYYNDIFGNPELKEYDYLMMKESRRQ
jgi:hypothetical protein